MGVKDKYLADRVSQVEAHNLDRELQLSIDSVIESLELSRFSDELKTILRLYITYNDIIRNATAGMCVYNLSYADISTLLDTSQPLQKVPNRYKQVLISTLNLTAQYAMKRYRALETALDKFCSDKLKAPWINLDNIVSIYRLLSIINFLVFLRTSKYLTLMDRLFGIGASLTDQGFCDNVNLNKVQIDYIYRERVWRSLSEFLSLTLPKIDFLALKNSLFNRIGIKPIMQTRLPLSERFLSHANEDNCGVCLKQPFNPFIIGCRHVFCYYCIQTKYCSDPANGYSCPSCNYNSKSIQRYRGIQRIE